MENSAQHQEVLTGLPAGLAFHVDDAKTVVVKHRQSEYGEVEVEKGLALLENVRKTLQLMRAIVQCTNASLQFGHAFGHAVGRSGLLLMTVQELARRLEMEVSDGRQEWMHILVSILGSCARVPENLEYFRDARAVDLLKKLKKESDMPIRVSSLRCLAHIADAEDTDLTQLEADDIDFFMNILNTALIEGGNDMEKEYAMLCVQRFAMVDSIRETIVSGTRIEAVLRALLTQQDQIYAVLRASVGFGIKQGLGWSSTFATFVDELYVGAKMNLAYHTCIVYQLPHTRLRLQTMNLGGDNNAYVINLTITFWLSASISTLIGRQPWTKPPGDPSDEALRSTWKHAALSKQTEGLVLETALVQMDVSPK
ncbi:Receptor-interacting serine/threonine-protein kinase 4 [Branchiostoma belcheri]|nr:Receptor-interacting serine/threonine-protein kinase 4 [Branchiostoma belcheri]